MQAYTKRWLIFIFFLAILRCHNCKYVEGHLITPEKWHFVTRFCFLSAEGKFEYALEYEKGLNVRYRFLMTNGPPGDFWSEHFSADEYYILPILLGFCLMYLMMILGVVVFAVELRSRQLLHTTYKLFAFSVVLQTWGITMQSVSLVQFAHDGVGFPRGRTFGKILESSSEVCFILVLLLMAKGYTITRGRLKPVGAAKLAVFMTLYSITHACLFFYQSLFFDPGEVLYLYESPPGYGIIVLRLIAWMMFVYSIVFTLRHYPEKSPFYYPFNLLGTCWFVAGPIFIIVANNSIDKWVREKVVCAVEHFIAYVGHMIFFFLTSPSRANKNFPYHVRTTQVGVMEEFENARGGPADNCLDHFAHHPYAPSAPLALSQPQPQLPPPDHMAHVPVELFSVSRAVVLNSNDIHGFFSQTPVENLRQLRQQDNSERNQHACSSP